jgi:hypothetical protein
LPEKEKRTFTEKLVQGITRQVLGQTLGNVGKFVERAVKRTLRAAALIIAGAIVTVLGIVFVAVGAVKWFEILLPAWLAWTIVGIILLLLGIAVALASLASFRS